MQRSDRVGPGTGAPSTISKAGLLILVVGVSMFGIGTFVGHDDGSDAAPAPSPDVLLVLRGEMSVDGTELALADPDVEWYAERPSPQAGSITVATLVSDWARFGFDADPPDAAISGVDAVVVLSDPILEDADRVTFRFEVLGGELPPRDGGPRSLFVDGADVAGGGPTIDPSSYPHHCALDPAAPGGVRPGGDVFFDAATDAATDADAPLDCSEIETLVAALVGEGDGTHEVDVSGADGSGQDGTWSCGLQQLPWTTDPSGDLDGSEQYEGTCTPDDPEQPTIDFYYRA